MLPQPIRPLRDEAKRSYKKREKEKKRIKFSRGRTCWVVFLAILQYNCMKLGNILKLAERTLGKYAFLKDVNAI